MILTTRYESSPKAAIRNISEKLMPVKIHVLKKASVVKPFYDIPLYFAKQRENGVFYLIAGNRILQY